MIGGATLLDGRDAVLAAAGGHPYARMATGGGGRVTGYLLDGTTVWTGPGPWGQVACALGDPGRSAATLAALASAGQLGEATLLHLPRIPAALLAAYLPVAQHHRWEFRWTSSPPPAQPGEDGVLELTDADRGEVGALVADAFPTSTIRPGDPWVARWFGIRAGGRLVAIGADRSAGGVGYLAGLTVATAWRGQGLGAALTAAMTRRLLADHEQVALGVLTDNDRAIRLYARLGFTSSLARTSVVPG